jgi:ABC-type lipoprotein release transport system permease subunit
VNAVVALAFADLRARWQRWSIAVLLLGLAAGISLAGAAGARRTDTAYARLLRSSDAADVQIAVSDPQGRQNLGGVSNFYAAVARLPDVDVIGRTTGVTATVPGPAHTSVLLRAGTDASLGQLIERPKLVDGRLFDPTAADEVVADRTLADQLQLHVGSTIDLVGPSADTGNASSAVHVSVRVVGVGVTRDNVVPVTALAPTATLLISPALLARFSPAMYTFEAAFVRLTPGVGLDQFRDDVQGVVDRFPETGGQLFVVDEHQQAANVSHAIRPQSVALLLFATIVALALVLIIGQIIVRQILVAANEHPTLRALGFSRAELASVGLIESGVVIVAGAAVAVVVAVVTSPLMPIGPARVAEPHPGLAINWAILAVGFVAIVLVFAARVLPSVWYHTRQLDRSAGGSPASGLTRPTLVLDILNRSRAPLSLTVGARLALDTGHGRSAVPVRSTLATTALAIAAVAAAVTFGSNLTRLVDTPRLYGQTWQVSIDAEFAQVARADVDTLLSRQPGVSGWTYGNHTEAAIDGRPIAGIELAAGNGSLAVPGLLEGRAAATPDEIVLGTNTLSDLHRRVADTVVVTAQDGSSRTMTVVGRAVFPFFGQGEVTPTGLGDGAALLDFDTSADAFNFVLVDVDSGPARNRDIAGLTAAFRASGVCPDGCNAVTTQPPTDVSNYARIKATPLVLAGVVALLALATIADLLITSTRLRRRDFAVLQSLGFLRRQVSVSVAWQATIIAAIALAVGLTTGILAGRWTWMNFAQHLGLGAVTGVPPVPILLTVPVGLAVANGIAAMPARRAAHRRPGPALRSE